ncbi:hypothetical protein [Streptomyces sp. NPDC050485]|uniref:hypothetical protein n=1 Tax=Streptomyces sp. NPDC050485 TaxID=3365617 RepID=UPI003792F5D8
MIAALVATCCVALGIALSPSMTGTAHADGTCGTPVQCANFTSLSNGRALDVQNGSLHIANTSTTLSSCS